MIWRKSDSFFWIPCRILAPRACRTDPVTEPPRCVPKGSCEGDSRGTRHLPFRQPRAWSVLEIDGEIRAATLLRIPMQQLGAGTLPACRSLPEARPVRAGWRCVARCETTLDGRRRHHRIASDREPSGNVGFGRLPKIASIGFPWGLPKIEEGSSLVGSMCTCTCCACGSGCGGKASS